MADNNTETTDKKKKPKKKGPIRFEAIIPVVIIIALVIAYFSLFFDAHLRRGLEWTASYVHGAEVNIADIDTSFLGGSFEMRGLQVTDKEEPSRNLVVVGAMKFQLVWDALLRAKFVVEKAAINEIAAFVPRKSPGWVKPPSERKGESAIKKAEENILAQAKEDYEQNVIGDLANIAGGVDPEEQLKKIEGELKASGRIKELEKELQAKEKAWKKRIEELPTDKELKELEQRFKALKFNTKDPSQFAKDLKEADKIIKEVEQKIQLVDRTGKDLKGDVNKYEQALKQLEKYVQQDIADLEKRLKIPSLDAGDFSKKLFARMFLSKLIGYRKYIEVAREYMPPKKTGEEKEKEAIVPPKRGEGVNHQFPITTGYPLFWLKHGEVSSEPSEEGFSGRVKGVIQDVTSNPIALGRPAVANIEGDFPKQNISGVQAKIVVDHTGEIPRESMEASVAAYPIDERTLTNSEDVKFAWNNAVGSTVVNAHFEQGELDVDLQNKIQSIDYVVEAEKPMVKEILQGVAKDVPVVEINAKANGRWDALRWRINSNIGRAIVAAFEKQVQVQIDKAKAKIRAEVEQRIAAERAKLEKEFKKIERQVTGVIEEKKAEVEQAKKQAQAQVNQEKKKAEGSAKKKLEKEGKKLLKGLGF